MSDNKIKFTADDFKSYDTIDELYEKWSSAIDPEWVDYDRTNDSEGYTPLCYAAMNGVKPDKIVYLVKNKLCNASRACLKGKTPLQCAILSGCSESVDALIGKKVLVYDEKGEVVKSNEKADEQPATDAAGNPLPARDDNDDIIYKKEESTGVIYPLEINDTDGRYSSTEPVVYQKCRLVKDGPLVDIPPSVSYNILYKYEDDGTHSIMRDSDGNPLKQCDDSGNEIHKKDVSGKDIRNKFEYVWDYEYQPEYEEAYKDKTVQLVSGLARISKADLCEASKLSKADILISLGDIYSTYYSNPKFNEIKDDFGNTLLYSACMISCYASVDYILETLVVSGRANYILTTCCDDETALGLSIKNKDEGLVEKLCGYLRSSDTDIGDILSSAFYNAWHSVINIILTHVIGPSEIYNWYINSYAWDGNDYNRKTVIQYIEEENDDDLYNLLLSEYIYSTHFSVFRSNKYYHILAYLYENNKAPFDNSSTKLQTLLLYDDIYAGTIKVLFDRGSVILSDICNISDLTKQNECIDKIFGSSYNRDLFISLLNTPNNSNALAHLYDNSYYSIYNLERLYLSHDVEYVTLFNVIKTIGVSASYVDSSIGYGDFKNLVIVSMFNESITDMSEIVSLSSNTASYVINNLYDNNSLNIQDYNIIYANYSEDLSRINDDLKPFIGKAKFSNSAISSSYFWAYNFSNRNSTHWSKPLDYYSSTPPLTSTSLQPVPGDKYISIEIVDGDIVYKPSLFLIEHSTEDIIYFQVGEEITHSSDINGLIVEFNDSLVTDKFILPLDLFYTNDDNIITWNTSHPLYRVFDGKRCYFGEIALADIIFDNSSESIAEGSFISREFKLSTEPNSNVTVNITSSNTNRLTVSPTVLTFTRDNWDTYQQVYLSAVNNSAVDGTEDVYVNIESTSSDVRFITHYDNAIQITVIDNDTAGIQFDSSQINVSEGGSPVIRSFRLNSKPFSNVTVSLQSSDMAKLTISPTVLTFTRDNWDTQQDVRFMCLGDSNRRDLSVSVGILSSSSDANYNNLSYSILAIVKNKVTLIFTNSSHPDLSVILPANIKMLSGINITLPEITGMYTDINNIIWQPSKWSIGAFNSLFTLTSNTVADLEFVRVSRSLGKLAFVSDSFSVETDISPITAMYPNIKVDFPTFYDDFDEP